MALEIIPNQPIGFIPADENPDACKCSQPQQCAVYQTGDDIYFQVKMTPCGDDFICGQPILGEELVINGTFASDAAGWTLDNASWNDGKVCVSSPAVVALTQNIAGLVTGQNYYVSYDISGSLGESSVISLWGTSGSTNVGDGTFTEVITAGGSPSAVDISFSHDFVGCIDNISIRSYHTCWTEDYSGDSPFTYSTDSVCVNGTGTLKTPNLGITAGLYVISFEISNYVSGSVTVKKNCTDEFTGGPPYSSNGLKYGYSAYGADGTLCFDFTSFIGCISDVHFYRVYIPQVSIINNDTGDQFLDLNNAPYINIYQDRVTYKFKPEDLLTPGCYKICVTDICGVAENNLVNGSFDVDIDGWTGSGNWTNDGSGHMEFDSGMIGNDPIVSAFTEGSSFMACAKIEVLDIKTNQSIIFRMLDGSTPVAQVGIGAPGIYSICGTGNKVEITTANADYVLVDNIIVRAISDCDDCSAFDYCSNCFHYETTFNCTKMITGICDDDAFGFIFYDNGGTNIFKLQHRLKCELNHAKYDQTQTDYIYSTGEARLVNAQSEKYQTLYCAPMPTYKHDVTALIKVCDDFQIDGADYYAKKGDYNPEWNTKVNTDLAPSRFDVKKKTQKMFNSLCE